MVQRLTPFAPSAQVDAVIGSNSSLAAHFSFCWRPIGIIQGVCYFKTKRILSGNKHEATGSAGERSWDDNDDGRKWRGSGAPQNSAHCGGRSDARSVGGGGAGISSRARASAI